MDELTVLQARISELERENEMLKSLLNYSGISYAHLLQKNNHEKDEFDPNQGNRIRPFEITDKVASNFFMMFCCGRKDVYALRYMNPHTSKCGYYMQCYNRWEAGCQRLGACHRYTFLLTSTTGSFFVAKTHNS